MSTDPQLSDPLSLTYLEHLVAERTPANTIKARTRVLRSLEPFGGAGTATREAVEAWWDSRTDKAASTRSNDLANLRTFYQWADRWEHRVNDDPTRRLTAPKVPKGVPRPISRADLHVLLGKLDDDLRRAVCLGAYGGLRVSEAAALAWVDIDLERRIIRVLGKGQKTRLVKVSMVLIDQLLPDTGRNVVTASADAYSEATLQRRVNRAIKAAGVAATFHQLRHRYGVVGYQATGDILGLMKQMGHASPATTMVYAEASDEVADRIAAAVVR